VLQFKRLNKLFTGYRPVNDGCSPVGAGGLFIFNCQLIVYSWMVVN
jgi:hypothetical protein